jgi:hypothetical protein
MAGGAHRRARRRLRLLPRHVGVVEGGLWPGQGGLRGSPQDVDADTKEAPLPVKSLLWRPPTEGRVRLTLGKNKSNLLSLNKFWVN